MLERELSQAFDRLAKQAGVQVFKAERARAGVPDKLVQTRPGLLLVELKVAHSRSNRLFSAKQRLAMRALNGDGLPRAVGLIQHQLRDGSQAWCVDEARFPSVFGAYSAGELVTFESLASAFRYLQTLPCPAGTR